MSSRSEAEVLYIVGAGGHGRELHSYVHDLVRAGWQGRLAGFLDDGLAPGVHRGMNVIGGVNSLEGGQAAMYITAFGDNGVRKKVVTRLESLYGSDLYKSNLRPFTLIHPSVMIGCGSEIGEGTCLAPGAIVTAKAKIGNHVILNVKASVSHDCVVGDFVNINPGATICGTVTVGEGAYIGAGSVVKDKIRIGAWSTVGAGAVVIRDVPDYATVVGVPAKVIRQGGEEMSKR